MTLTAGITNPSLDCINQTHVYSPESRLLDELSLIVIMQTIGRSMRQP